MVETRTIVYDEQLQIEAYQFVGNNAKISLIIFNDCYVVGFVEKAIAICLVVGMNMIWSQGYAVIKSS